MTLPLQRPGPGFRAPADGKSGLDIVEMLAAMGCAQRV
jgi:hypothetical protein